MNPADVRLIEQGRGFRDAARKRRLDALAERLSPELAVLLPAIAKAAQQAVEDALRGDGTLANPRGVGGLVAYAIAPILEHGPDGGWCPRCGRSARFGELDVCGLCETELDADSAPER